MTPLAVYVDTVDADLHDGPALLREAGFDLRVVVASAPHEVAKAALGATALLVGDAPVTAEVLDAAPSLRIVSTVTAGTDHLDLEAARERGVWVSNVPDVSTEEVAAHALGMALSLIRQLSRFDREVRAGGWDALSGRRPLRPSVLTLGIVGLGRIGARLAAISRPLYGRVLGSDPALSSAPEGVALVGLDELLAESHVVSLHLPALPGKRRLIDHGRLASMRPGALLVNVSRGALVDQAALLAMLDSGHLGGAALDVLAVEPPHPEEPLLRHPDVLLSPHAAYLSDHSERDGTRCQAENVVAWARTGRPPRVVVEGRP
jgi:phosphoglycerate dehydrogenase-like enzyme